MLAEELKIQFWEICFRTYGGRNLDTNVFDFRKIEGIQESVSNGRLGNFTILRRTKEY